MKRLLTTTTLSLALLRTAHADPKTFDEMKVEAVNHGFNSAALSTCVGTVVVTNPKLRAKLDRMYRDNPKWKAAYQEGFESGSPPDGVSSYKTISKQRLTTCILAGADDDNAGWLKLTEEGRLKLIEDASREAARNKQ